ncbi:nucleotidyltransferase [Alkaliphilus hydrothermalis]|uniref:tRNA(Met) cytidine acetate ligase n=1 Tax=Alkaliphilus hydrothermalis TaxID=1482730 RepID=A0ABS2NL04_9FIRM|nr:nucleotidyltransferase [Alkaliphilus hydrothermalis]MBM7613615.1 putative nucleotidyltransferase [Alkaliphilus hydrothermalis]
MKVLGLITEHNPFHNGHLYHLQESLRVTGATHSISVMSGNFLQRGEPALLHKWQRAKMAVLAGIDLVIELPTIYACATAEYFAYGSVKLLDQTGVVDALCFGSEEGNLKGLKLMADLLVNPPEKFEDFLQQHLQRGVSFPVAREEALKVYLKEENGLPPHELDQLNKIINNPNNILSIEYLKALKKINSKITPYTILRKKAGYHSTDLSSDIASATAIREHLRKMGDMEGIRQVVPPTTYDVLKESFEGKIGPIFAHDYHQSIMTLIRRSPANELASIFDVNEGLENRIKHCGLEANDYKGLLECIKSKRYPLTRIQRIMMHLLIGLKRDEIETLHQQGGPQYIRVLAFNDKGRELLKLMKKKATVPIVTKINQYSPQNEAAKRMLEIDIRATDVYALGVENEGFRRLQMDYLESPFYFRG